MADIAILASEVAPAPQDYTLPGAQEILLRAVGCQINGTNASGEFLPALQMLDPAGHVMWTAVNVSLPVAAGGTALVSWFPGGGVENAGTGTTSTPATGSAGTISEITSSGGSISVATPSGPVTNVDVANSGVTGGTYGDSTHVSQVIVGNDGRVTSASSIAISGSAGAGGLITLYDSGYLAGDAASIDTGAGGVPSGHGNLYVWAYLRTSDVVSNQNVVMRLNNDSGANYNYSRIQSSGGGAPGGTSSTAQTSALIGNVAGASADANVFGPMTIEIPAYDQTTNKKAGNATSSMIDTTSAHFTQTWMSFMWTDTSAISRLAVFSQSGGNLKAGSRLMVLGTQ